MPTDALAAADQMVAVPQRRAPGAAPRRLSRELRLPAAVSQRDGERLAPAPVAASIRDGGANAFVRARAGGRQRRSGDAAHTLVRRRRALPRRTARARRAAMALFCAPTINAYGALPAERDGAAVALLWGRDNRGAMLRVLGRLRRRGTRIENRIGEPMRQSLPATSRRRSTPASTGIERAACAAAPATARRPTPAPASRCRPASARRSTALAADARLARRSAPPGRRLVRRSQARRARAPRPRPTTRTPGRRANTSAASERRSPWSTIPIHLVDADGRRHDLQAHGRAEPDARRRSTAGIDGIKADCGGLMTCATCHVYRRRGLGRAPAARPRATKRDARHDGRGASTDEPALSCQIVLRRRALGLTARDAPRRSTDSEPRHSARAPPRQQNSDRACARSRSLAEALRHPGAGVLLTVVTLMTCVSLIGRNLIGMTIVGDFELVGRRGRRGDRALHAVVPVAARQHHRRLLHRAGVGDARSTGSTASARCCSAWRWRCSPGARRSAASTRGSRARGRC